MWDFVMDKSVPGAGFFRELRFPLPIYIPSASPQSSSLSPEAGTIGRSANSLTNQIIIKKIICNIVFKHSDALIYLYTQYNSVKNVSGACGSVVVG
jgi:hypothetical protein